MNRLVQGILFFCLSAPVLGDSLRCRNHIVQTGMSRVEVQQRCGTPASVHHEAMPVWGKRGATKGVAVVDFIEIEHWTYNQGTNQLMVTFTFEEGHLKKIKTGGYAISK